LPIAEKEAIWCLVCDHSVEERGSLGADVLARNAHVLIGILRFPKDVMPLTRADREPHVTVTDVARARIEMVSLSMANS